MTRPVRVLVACDSFKGTVTATDACAALAEGWRSVRPDDAIDPLPFADGGEGTLDALAAALTGPRPVPVPDVTGPDGRRVDARYLLLEDGTAVVEFASASGLPLMATLDPLGATSRGTGEVLAAATRAGVRRVVLGVGGSATSDGAAGLLEGLGLRILDAAGLPVAPGARGLPDAVRVDRAGLLAPPPDGVLVLADVDNPLLGERGAAAVFSPQKGAGPDDVAAIERALTHWADLIGADRALPGGGAAGGTPAGLAAFWPAEVVGGSAWIAEVTGLDARAAAADLVITGEGRFDATSLGGKAVGHVLGAAARAGTPALVVAGVAAPPDGFAGEIVELADLAGSARRARAEARTWLVTAGARAATQLRARRPAGPSTPG